ncbi:MAG: histidine kinase dimerization/phospho-acceptor domain-containing protein, partial [Bacteroidota bacterium]
MKSVLKKYYLDIIVAVISLLLIGDIVIIYYNNLIIKHNRELQLETEQVKLFTEQIGKSTIHGIDIGLRGYVIVQNEQFFSPVDSAVLRKDSILYNVESRLEKQGYNLTEFYALRDSLNSYIGFCLHLKQLLVMGNKAKFYELFSTDKGLDLWLQYLQFVKNVSSYEGKINAQAQQRYEAALRNNYILQIILFVICFPTLLYTVYYTKRTFKLAELLHVAEAEKNKILISQNLTLETKVGERTKEIATQNEELVQQQEEIAAQRDALSLQNKKLSEAQEIIEKQNLEIQSENNRLESLVQVRTKELQQTNQELAEHNNQLEQFAFIAAHNLRAPLARILGLAKVLELSTEDREFVFTSIIDCTRDLERVIKDLNVVLELKKQNGVLTTVHLSSVLDKVKKILEKEGQESHANISVDLTQGNEVYAILPYIESIFFN